MTNIPTIGLHQVDAVSTISKFYFTAVRPAPSNVTMSQQTNRVAPHIRKQHIPSENFVSIAWAGLKFFPCFDRILTFRDI